MEDDTRPFPPDEADRLKWMASSMFLRLEERELVDGAVPEGMFSVNEARCTVHALLTLLARVYP